MKKIFLKFIRIYQFLFSPILHTISPFAGCRFYPTCSDYSHEAVQRYGIFKGVTKSVWRILRCNPLSKGGVDPVN